MRIPHRILFPAAWLLLAACQNGAENPPAPEAQAGSGEASAPASFLPDALRAFGTEPFWSAEIDGATMIYTTPEDYADGASGQGTGLAVTRVDGEGEVVFRGALAGEELSILVTPGPCNDGMSDNTYLWSVERSLGGQSVQGCARPLEG